MSDLKEERERVDINKEIGGSLYNYSSGMSVLAQVLSPEFSCSGDTSSCRVGPVSTAVSNSKDGNHDHTDHRRESPRHSRICHS